VVSVAVVADDLSGAVEAAASFLLHTSRVVVTLSAQATAPARTEVYVVDTDSRSAPASEAAGRVDAVVRALGCVPLVVKKVDSLLRGNLAAELGAVRQVRPHLVVALALPAAGRTVVGGVVDLDGVPLHRTDAWRAEAGVRPSAVADALAPLPIRTVGLNVVRGTGLAGELRAAASRVPTTRATGRATRHVVPRRISHAARIQPNRPERCRAVGSGRNGWVVTFRSSSPRRPCSVSAATFVSAAFAGVEWLALRLRQGLGPRGSA